MPTHLRYASDNPCIDNNTYCRGPLVSLFENGNFNASGIGMNWDLLAGTNINVAGANRRTISNPVRIRLPDSNQSNRCGVELNNDGIAYISSGGTAQTINLTPDGGLGGGRNGPIVFDMRFPEPVDVMMTFRSFNGSAGEYARFTTGPDEFIAGSGSNLATSPTGYPNNTYYQDNNAGGSIAIWRQRTIIRVLFNGNNSLAWSSGVKLLKYYDGYVQC